ncbi:predicted protein [Chaetomium globosum CBS 148.51]|uniref:Uncharacterized protein n=1 Tax=Chaetomium globosum (strain ATCC 6205 / CBS 148.51 / DSM 1962 / NBRC 6347 / NRRL 1970) TaxID=306901 RepID=Q2H2A8_CHAGB|nr:uncharacterized protein CHGG_04088 [Chaetomium globosum CBS 148.51]EAQ87469.1 predicted protein [Chaetomium globosum CBS 148.51]
MLDPFCPVTGKRHPVPGSAKFTEVCKRCKTTLLLDLVSDDDSDHGISANSALTPVSPVAIPPAQPSQSVQPTQSTPDITTTPRPSQAGQALTGFNKAHSTALAERNSPNPNVKPVQPSPVVISITLEVFAADVDVVTIGGQETRRWTEVGSISSCLPVQVPLDQHFANHEHIIRYLLDNACRAKKFAPSEFRFIGKLSAGKNKKVSEMTSLDPERPVTFRDLHKATTNRGNVKPDENVSLYLLKEKLYPVVREEREDLAVKKTAKRARSDTQGLTAIASSSKLVGGLSVLSKKAKLEQDKVTKKDQEERVKEEPETSESEANDDKLIGTIKDDLTGRSLMRKTWRNVAEYNLIPAVACEVD